MGREVRRVPLDFEHPIGKVWAGYLLPDELRLADCPECNGYGRDATYRWVESITRLLLMVGEDISAQERGRPLHPYLSVLEGSFTTRPVEPSATALSTGLAGRSPSFLGHDAIDNWTATKKVVQAAGLDPETWAVCPTCRGKGDTATDEQRAAHDAWEAQDPPQGEGWQLWETVSEGSPVSPVFATEDALAEWMADPARGDRWLPLPAAQRFVEAGWAPSLVVTPEAGVQSGTEWVGMQDRGTVSR